MLLTDARANIQAWSWRKKLVVSIVVIAVCLATVLVPLPDLAALQRWSLATGKWFFLLYLLLYVAMTQLPIPRTIFTLSAGVLFGPKLGILLAISATMISAGVSLATIRYFLGEWIQPKLHHPAVHTINTRIEQRGWLAVGSLRMIPGVPFSILNYVAALTPIPWLWFVLATGVGSAPGTIATVLLGHAAVVGFDSRLLMISLGFACLGTIGLIIDNKLPVKPLH